METQDLPGHPREWPTITDDRAARRQRPQGTASAPAAPPTHPLAKRTCDATGRGAHRSENPSRGANDRTAGPAGWGQPTAGPAAGPQAPTRSPPRRGGRRANGGNALLPLPVNDGTPAIGGVDRDANPSATQDRAAAAALPPPPGTLELSIRRRGAVIELGLAGDLDMATAPRLGEAMAWLRFSRDPAATIVIDTSNVAFIAAAGYRALQGALVGPNGLWDPRVALVVGPAVARFEAAITAASARHTRRSEASQPRASTTTHDPSGPRGPWNVAR